MAMFGLGWTKVDMTCLPVYIALHCLPVPNSHGFCCIVSRLNIHRWDVFTPSIPDIPLAGGACTLSELRGQLHCQGVHYLLSCTANSNANFFLTQMFGRVAKVGKSKYLVRGSASLSLINCELYPHWKTGRKKQKPRTKMCQDWSIILVAYIHRCETATPGDRSTFPAPRVYLETFFQHPSATGGLGVVIITSGGS